MTTTAILGATGSIGSALARLLVTDGGRVLLLGRDHDKLAALAAELDQPFATIDLATSKSLEDALGAHSDQCGGYTGLANCVGSLLLKPAHATSDDEFRDTLETNLFSAFATVRAGGKLLRQHGGAIVLFASAAADIGLANHEAIAAAKGGVVGLARAAAATYAPNNIRINVISPGLVRTELTRRIWETPATAAASAGLHALGRLGEPEQVASLAAWLLDAGNDWITGQVIGLDGGLSRVQPRQRSRPTQS
jgi:3-oxoacyl-[acyl-carrier protein] reductase